MVDVNSLPDWLGTVPQWLTAVFSGGLAVAVARTAPGLLKAWNEGRKITLDDKRLLRSEKRDELHECTEKLDRLGERFDGLQDTVNNLKIEMSAVLSAYRILEGKVERDDPDCLSLKHARSILSAAFTVAPSTPPRDHTL